VGDEVSEFQKLTEAIPPFTMGVIRYPPVFIATPRLEECFESPEPEWVITVAREYSHTPLFKPKFVVTVAVAELAAPVYALILWVEFAR